MLFTGDSPPQPFFFDFEALKYRFIRGKPAAGPIKRDFGAPKWDFQGGIGQKWSKFGHWPKLSVPINPPLGLAEILSEGGGFIGMIPPDIIIKKAPPPLQTDLS